MDLRALIIQAEKLKERIEEAVAEKREKMKQRVDGILDEKQERFDERIGQLEQKFADMREHRLDSRAELEEAF